MAKSAILGLHCWLTDAIEGPTPVSALLHAATLVTAGVYLLIRGLPLYSQAPVALAIVLTVAAITAAIAAILGCSVYDLKRVIALSTGSQMGLMAMAAANGFISGSLSHVIGHGAFKATLFVAAGLLVAAGNDHQDLRLIGARPNHLASMTIATASLALVA